MLTVIMLTVIMLTVIMLTVIMLTVIMLSVSAPFINHLGERHYLGLNPVCTLAMNLG
jgi:hypothetical protein